jgi:hypothetical protein
MYLFREYDMIRKRVIGAASAFAFIAAAQAASAATADFTGDSFRAAQSGDVSTVTIGGVDVTIESGGGALVFTPARSGDPVTPLTTALGTALAVDTSVSPATGYDGAGVGDDEVTGKVSAGESLTVSFSQSVYVTSLSFLDFFKKDHDTTDPNHIEEATVAFNFSGGGSSTKTILATTPLTSTGFFTTADASILPAGLVDSIVFTARVTDSAFRADDGGNDYALAAVEFSAVPLPAPALMLLGGLAGFGFFRRRAT